MSTYIALLRGINVSGQKLVKMADLRMHLAELSFDNIQIYIQSGNIYIQSGNIVFECGGKSSGELENLIRNKIQEKYGFEVPTLVRTPSDFKDVLTRNPFVGEEEVDPKLIYITFLSDKPQQEKVENLKDVDYSPEKYVVDGDIVFLFPPNGYGKAKMNNNFFESKLKVNATTRNWKTVNILLEMSSQNQNL